MSQTDQKTGIPKTRNPYTLPARQRGQWVLKDRRQGRGGARDWRRRWFSAYLEEQLNPFEETMP